NVTDIEGKFQIQKIPEGTDILQVVYLGYAPYTQKVNISGTIDLGTIKLKTSATQLQNVTVESQAIRATQSGDTVSFNANAFKTNPDANAEDLLNKMPGITTQGGTIKANGEEITTVLVDGKPFFGDDPNTAIKNLPAEIIDRIQ